MYAVNGGKKDPRQDVGHVLRAHTNYNTSIALLKLFLFTLLFQIQIVLCIRIQKTLSVNLKGSVRKEAAL